MATFNFKPSLTTAAKVRTRIKKMQFGDGYMQRSVDGINFMIRDWNVVFNNIDDLTADAIEAFLVAHIGLSFDWTPPRAVAPCKYICVSWDRSFNEYNSNNLTLPFEQVFE